MPPVVPMLGEVRGEGRSWLVSGCLGLVLGSSRDRGRLHARGTRAKASLHWPRLAPGCTARNLKSGTACPSACPFPPCPKPLPPSDGSHAETPLNASPPRGTPPPPQIFDAATVRRVDPALGLLLELPASPSPCAAFAHVSNLADGRTERPEKVFKAGQAVRARVIGFRLVDGLALVSLKPSVLSQQVGAGPRPGPWPPLWAIDEMRAACAHKSIQAQPPNPQTPEPPKPLTPPNPLNPQTPETPKPLAPPNP